MRYPPLLTDLYELTMLAGLPQGCLRLINPHRYKVSIFGRLNDLRNRLIDQRRSEGT